MCGISGLKRMGADSTPIAYEQIVQLLLSLEHRGNHATGMSFQSKDGKIETFKNADAAWQFVNQRNTKKFVEEHLSEDVMTVILHNRAWTVGPPSDNKNNHPVSSGVTAIVHNGGIQNHDRLFREMQLKRGAAVDSDIIRAILDAYGLTPEGVKNLNKMEGGAAIAAISEEYPGKLLLGRSGNPLVIAALEEENQLIWASEKDAIHAAARPWKQKWNMFFKSNSAELVFNPMEKEKIYLIGDEGAEWYMDFNISGGRKTNTIYRLHDTMPEKKKQLRGEENREFAKSKDDVKPGQVSAKPARMRCPNIPCGILIKFRDDQKGQPMWKLECPKCSTRLGDEA